MGGCDLILVTVGTHDQPFDRLVRAMDEVAQSLDERVIIQRGCTDYVPQNAESFDFTTSEHMVQLTGEARVVVSHAAAGAIIVALKVKAPLVLVPRLEGFGEVVDDHQLQLAQELRRTGRAVVVNEVSVDYLHRAIRNVSQMDILSRPSTLLTVALRKQLSLWSKQDCQVAN